MEQPVSAEPLHDSVVLVVLSIRLGLAVKLESIELAVTVLLVAVGVLPPP